MENIDIAKAMDAIGEKVDGFKATTESVQKSLDSVSEKQELMSRQILDLQQSAHKAEYAGPSSEKLTVGAQFVKSDSYKAFQNNMSKAVAVKIEKAEALPIMIGSLGEITRRPGVMAEPVTPITIESLIPHLQTATSTIEYLCEKEFQNGAAFIAEGALKPSSSLSFELKQTTVQTIAHWTKITKQLADDSAALQDFINARMVYGVNAAVEAQLLTGDGTASNLSGLMKEGNFTKQAFTAADLGKNPTLLDLLRLSIALVNNNGYSANAIILNPMDWAKLQGVKGSNDHYLLGVPNVSFNGMNAWGVRVVTCATMAEGKYLVGDFTQAATIYDRMSTVLDMASQNEDDFIKNLYTIRAERRLALAIEHPSALVGGDFVVPAA